MSDQPDRPVLLDILPKLREKKEPHPMLEPAMANVLDEARAGQIDCFALVFVRRDGTSENFMVSGDRLTTMLGAVTLLQDRVTEVLRSHCGYHSPLDKPEGD